MVEESASVTFRLPPHFTGPRAIDGVREWRRGGDAQQYVFVGFMPTSAPVATLGRAPSPGMREMTQCVDSVAGREVLVQAWRTVGGTFRESHRRDRYDVFAVAPVNPLLRFYVASGGYERRTQELALAIVRTLAVGVSAVPDRPTPPP